MKKFFSNAWNGAASILLAAAVTGALGIAYDEIVFHVEVRRDIEAVSKDVVTIKKKLGIETADNQTNQTQKYDIVTIGTVGKN